MSHWSRNKVRRNVSVSRSDSKDERSKRHRSHNSNDSHRKKDISTAEEEVDLGIKRNYEHAENVTYDVLTEKPDPQHQANCWGVTRASTDQTRPLMPIPPEYVALIEALIADALAKNKSDEYETSSNSTGDAEEQIISENSAGDSEEQNTVEQLTNGESIHTFTYMTVVPAQPFRAAYLMSSSFLLLVAQCFVLTMTVFESSTMKCAQMEQCPAGTWCAGLGEGLAGGAGLSGSCYDCYFADNATDGWAAGAVGSQEIIDGIEYCTEHDMHPDYCDILYDNLEKVSLATLVILMFITIMATECILEDIDQAGKDIEVVWNMLEHEGTWISEAKMVAVFVLHYLRRWVLTGLVIGATAAVIVTDEMTIINIVLNGVAMASMMVVDDFLFIMVPPKDKQLMQQVLAQAGERKAKKQTQKENHMSCFEESWYYRRVYGVLMGGFCITAILKVFHVAELTSPFLDIAFDSSGGAPISQNNQLCGTFQIAFLNATLFSMAIGALTDASRLLRHLRSFLSTGFCPPVRDVLLPLCAPLIAWGFLAFVIVMSKISYNLVAIPLIDASIADGMDSPESTY